MNSKRFNFHVITFIAIITLGNSFFIIESSAFIYSNPSTTPIWSYSTGKQYISAVAISDDGNYIVASSKNLVTNINEKAYGKLYLFNNSLSSPLWNYSIENKFYSLAISEDGSNIIAGGGYYEQKVYFFNNLNRIPQWTYFIGGWVYDVDISSDGYYTAAVSGDRRKVFLFNNTDHSPILEFSTTGLALRVVLSSNGSYMAVTDNVGKLYFFNTSSSSPKWTYNISGDVSVALSISADGNYIASGGDKIYFFKKNSSIPIWIYDVPDEICAIKISKDGNYIVAGGGYTNQNIYFFNKLNSTPEWIYLTRGEIASVDISSNGEFIAAQSYDQFIYLFNKTSLTPVWRYKIDGSFTSSYDYSLETSSDGKYIVVGGRHRIYLFDRDIIIAPKLIISGYNLFLILIIIGIILLSSVAAFLLKYKRIQRKFSN